MIHERIGSSGVVTDHNKIARLNEIKETLAEARTLRTGAFDALMDDPIGGGIRTPPKEQIHLMRPNMKRRANPEYGGSVSI